MTNLGNLPVAVIGGGPVGLAAAAHLVSRGIPVKLYEAGAQIGTNLRDWGHVRVFTPWRYCVDAAARKLLEGHGWRMPEEEAFPTGGEIVGRYVAPLASLPELAPSIETNARVVAVSRWGADKVLSKGREHKPFMLLVETADGRRRDSARAVIDASGTWQTPNPLGAGGIPAEGEMEFGSRIAYGIPDILGRDRHTYAGRTTLVVGSGHSAANALLELAELGETEPGTSAIWVTRSTDLVRIYGGGDLDALPARGELGSDVQELAESGRVQLVTGFATTAIREVDGRLVVEGLTTDGVRKVGPVDRIIAATGQRPDLSMTRELRLDLNPWLEGVKALGPLIDPNEHSCGDVPPHGHRELSHPEPGFYTVGIKSYGRAPTFLLLTGYEQVRSVAAAIAGDIASADAVHLALPETGVCTTTRSISSIAEASKGCCGGPAPKEVDACCVADAEAKAEGKSGCGCGVAA
ncbi:NAD(P)/FAD-dependent oxidoreductase [Mesorhizobium sp. M4B.F.Ca.ET.169.01.1.1]|uniref:NAD(P)-binding domain-containing protein n=2 Tax=Mesorhizobium TaxID=68287 RepID=UPI000FCABE19|nr:MULTISPECIES: NAD(P)-binding domain-containing protein [unclassified Mesorhizobium]RUW19745.1 NAD(P)/FAD-dependent oxidoreductase [Mesorhizobium sp. M4B.F.Ca.ET.013.02.1.1]RVD43687.1 NAD(P)/FAD-dependent oxidoreductase [Mesorhizobium sp. M4B.F.Ca.ET.019.03.1.1]TGT38810.1 NAD(P)/FAD-dependent oxidoreductase [Mesorhizobium sp. M4B.F.Ca.ET.169.01.1.1]TIW98419.1 MAG: NAD(P)/FAD-dependent oxidoreductase [Mesorhizobium sp.]